MRYAVKTSVSIDKSRTEIEKLLSKFGCDGFGYNTFGQRAQIQFATNNRMIRFVLNLPARTEFDGRKIRLSKTRTRPITPDESQREWDQACRSKWRALALAIKSKLVTVESGIAEFESEFMAQIVDPLTNQTMAEIMLPQIEQRYLGNQIEQLMLPALPEETKK